MNNPPELIEAEPIGQAWSNSVPGTSPVLDNHTTSTSLILYHPTELDDPNPNLGYNGEAETTKKQYIFPWETMPYEIRDHIFAEMDEDGYYGYFEWDGEPPALLEALRPLKTSHGHVLEWFARHGYNVSLYLYVIPMYTRILLFMSERVLTRYYSWHGFDLTSLTKTEMTCVTKVNLELSQICDQITTFIDEDTNEWVDSFRKPTFFTDQFLSLTNLREVYLSLDLDNNVCQSQMTKFMTQWLFWLQGCKALKKLTVEIPVASWMIDAPSRARNIDGLVRRIFQKTGVQGRYVEQVGERFHEEADVWIWEAPDGKLMDWSQELCREWKRPHATEGRTSVVDFLILSTND
ncbi:hypothetical protein IFR05_010023 [Cadophora sp. M221]|nr:hypothetical protein IFR05_010023 [Cadophora sp. M221]